MIRGMDDQPREKPPGRTVSDAEVLARCWRETGGREPTEDERADDRRHFRLHRDFVAYSREDLRALAEPERHRIYYESDRDRHYWECQECSMSGSVPEHADPEIAAERAHARVGITNLSTVSRRLHP